jgi:hypothetical protein
MDPERTPSLRASDSDRERATEILNHALSIGQLSFDEHETRLQAALQATGVDELWRLTQDLTGTSNARPKRRSPGISLALVVGAIMAVLLAGIIGASLNGGTTSPVSRISGPTSTTLPIVTSTAAARAVPPSPYSASSNGVTLRTIPPGEFGSHDPSDECGPFGAYSFGYGENCYVVVQFTNVSSSAVSVTPADIDMVDQTGDTYNRIEPVAPVCYDTIDVNAAQTLPPQGHLDVQLCWAVQTGALPQTLEGTGSLSGLTLAVPEASIVGTWGGD